MLADPAFDARQTVVLDTGGSLTLPGGLRAAGTAEVTVFAPEAITIAVHDNPDPAILSLALPHYPGWKAYVDGQPAGILRAYGALSAVVLPEDARTVVLEYDPWTFTVGAVVSLLAWGGVAVAGGWLMWRRQQAAGTRPGRSST